MSGLSSNKYSKTYTSFAGADIIATFTPKGGKPKIIGEIQTISYSTYRPTKQVYAIGKIGPKGVVRGHRTIAGSLIFTVFDRHVLKDMMNDATANGVNCEVKPDNLPPFDVTVTFLNENGNSSILVIHGVSLVSEGQTMSVEDMITENTMSYVALDVTHMENTYIKYR